MPPATVHALFLKPAKGHRMMDVSDIGMSMEQGYGIQGDCHKNPLSPRQVLLVRLEDLDSFKLQPGDLRENIVINGLAEDAFVPGAILQIGTILRVRLTFYCEPCKRISHVVASLKDIIGKRGVLGTVLRGGHLRCGDNVVVTGETKPPLSDIPYNRFLTFISYVPRGVVVTYKEVVIGMGVAESYIRAIPRYLQKTPLDQYPIHRVVDTEGRLIPEYVPGQIELLRHEGIELFGSDNLFDTQNYQLDLRRYLWNGNPIYCTE